MFSIIIPSWNNLSYLTLCIESILKNSSQPHQIIVHVNEGSDGTIEYLKMRGIEYTRSGRNIGICYAVNEAGRLIRGNYVVYMNDDMYVLPGWDEALLAVIATLPNDNFMLSATMIEPNDTGNPCVVHQHFGTDAATFDEETLLANYMQQAKADWYGSAWPPTLVSSRMWTLVGGYSIEFSPGLSSDDDFARKMWEAGCREFRGVGTSRVYHFQSKSLHKIKRNNGRKQFLHKWGINQSTFNNHYLKRGQPYEGPLPEPDANILSRERLRARWKMVWQNLGGK
ncbi:MAG: glycosyltransferase [Edaphocola sp.]